MSRTCKNIFLITNFIVFLLTNIGAQSRDFIDFQVDSIYNIDLNADEYSFVIMSSIEPNALYHFNSTSILEKINLVTKDKNIVTLPKSLMNRVYSTSDVTIDKSTKQIQIRNNSGKYYLLSKESEFHEKRPDALLSPDEYFRFNLVQDKLFLLSSKSEILAEMEFEKNEMIIVDSLLTFRDFLYTPAVESSSYVPTVKKSEKIVLGNEAFISKKINGRKKDGYIILNIAKDCRNCYGIVAKNNLMKFHYQSNSENTILQIGNELLWINSYRLVKYNLSTREETSINISLPKCNLNFITTDQKGWWILDKKIYYIDAINGHVAVSSTAFDTPVEDFFQDDKYFYLKFRDQFKIINKAYLKNQLSAFDHLAYKVLNNNYEEGLSNLLNSSFDDVTQHHLKIDSFISEHKQYIEVSGSERHYENCFKCIENINYRNSFIEKFKENKLDIKFVKNNISNVLISTLRDGYFENALIIDSIMSFRDLKVKDYYDENRIKNTLDSIRSYFQKLRLIEQSGLDRDTIDLLKVLALNKVCRSSVFCHEGCGGCDVSLVSKKLKRYINSHRKYKDIASYIILENDKAYEEEYFIEDIAEYEKFIKKYPKSSYVMHAIYKIINILRYVEETNNDGQLKNKILQYINQLENNYSPNSDMLTELASIKYEFSEK